MKQALTLFLSCLFTTVFAQSSFEGKITYIMKPLEQGQNGEVIIYYGKPGIRFQVKELAKVEKAQPEMIVNFDSGKVYTLNPSTKTYSVSALRQRTAEMRLDPAMIAGFATTPMRMETLGMTGLMASAFTEAILYPADDLRYFIPEKYVGNPELLMIQKGRILLGAKIFAPDYQINQWNLNKTMDTSTKPKIVFEIMASEVIKQTLTREMFQVPNDYIPYDFRNDTTTITSISDDSISPVMPLNMNTTEPRKRTVPKNKKSLKKKPSPSKPKSSLRKND